MVGQFQIDLLHVAGFGGAGDGEPRHGHGPLQHPLVSWQRVKFEIAFVAEESVFLGGRCRGGYRLNAWRILKLPAEPVDQVDHLEFLTSTFGRSDEHGHQIGAGGKISGDVAAV